jgi:hypothetical protein|tara:strand:- start:606 stop:908 length:303 start_codon:yes stop_codon:yes gene_type:complete
VSVRSILLSVAVLIAVSVTGVSAEPKPGDIYAEYVWRGPYYNASTWQRVTDPNAAAAGARQFLPNRRNRITIEDLEGAIAAEVHIEQWGATRARRTQRFA